MKLTIIIVLTFLTAVSLVAQSPLNGTFTIGGNSPDFVTVQAAVESLRVNGVSGPVTLNIRAGTYRPDSGVGFVMRMDFAVPGVSSENTITFQPDAATGATVDNVFLEHWDPPASQWIVEIWTKYVTISHLTIADRDTSGNRALGLILIKGDNGVYPGSNVIIGCKLFGNGFPQGSRTDYAVLSASPNSDIVIADNYIDGCASGIVVAGNPTYRPLIRNNTILRAVLSGFAISAIHCVDAVVRGNLIDHMNMETGHSIYLAGFTNAVVDGNRVRNGFTYNAGSNRTAIAMEGGTNGIVSNNMISDLHGGYRWGITVGYAENVTVCYNTVYLDEDPSTGQSTALRLYSGNAHHTVRNNILIDRKASYWSTLEFDLDTNTYTSDYNIIVGANLVSARNLGTFQSLAAWQAKGQDAHTFSEVPVFADSLGGDLHLAGSSVQDTTLTAIPVNPITRDIDGDLRSETAPFRGADEPPVVIPMLNLGVPDSGHLPSGIYSYYRIDKAFASTLQIEVTGNAETIPCEIYASFNQLPSRSDFEFRSIATAQNRSRLLVPSTLVGSYYIMLYNSSGYTIDYNILPKKLSFQIVDVSPGRIGDAGRVTLKVYGAGFQDSAKVYLQRDTLRVGFDETAFVNAANINVRLRTAGLQHGLWDIVVANNDSEEITLDDAITVEAATPVDVQTSFTGPSLLSVFRARPFSYSITNNSNSDIDRIALDFHIRPDLVAGATLTSFPDPELQEGATLTPYVDSVESQLHFPIMVYNLAPGVTTSIPLSLLPKGTGDYQFTVDLAVMRKADYDTVCAQTMREGIEAGLIDTTTFPSASMKFAMRSRSVFGFGVPCGDENAGVCEAIQNRNRNIDIAVSLRELATDTFTDFYFPFSKPSFDLTAFLDLKAIIQIAKRAIDFHNDFKVSRQYGKIKVVGAHDPNSIAGPVGVGAGNWIVPQQLLYTINFENDPDSATAPAQEVRVYQQLDSTLDLNTFRVHSFGFGSHAFTVPEDHSSYQTQVDVRQSLGLDVEFKSGIVGDSIYFKFESIDPNTQFPVIDPLTGFLPVNDSTGRGEGYVTYTIEPKAGLATGQNIFAMANIFFDLNNPIATPTIFNTLDGTAPISTVTSLSDSSPTSFLVSWEGNDDAGVMSYSVYVSEDGGPFQPWIGSTGDTSAMFNGIVGKTYGFFSIAADSAGNIEVFKLTAEVSTAVIAGVDDMNTIPQEFRLDQNFPNPFNPTTIIRYEIPRASHVTLKLYNMIGQEIATLVDDVQEAGYKTVKWNAANVPSGVYFYRLQASGFTTTREMLIIK